MGFVARFRDEWHQIGENWSILSQRLEILLALLLCLSHTR